MSDTINHLSFQDCWMPPRPKKNVRGRTSGYFSTGQGGGKANSISSHDKARLARVAKRAPEVMIKVSKPARTDKSGNLIKVSRQTENARVSAHFEYISRNGKIELETSNGEILEGKQAVSKLFKEWEGSHHEDYLNRDATDRTRLSTNLILSMPENTNAKALKEAVRAFAEEEFGGRNDYVMALHTDVKHPHVHLTVRTVGYDGSKLNFRKVDLQHMRDVFAEKLRARGIEAESTPRFARGVARKSEKTPVYKMRQRGHTPFVDKAKRNEIKRDFEDNSGQFTEQIWDKSILDHRNKVLRTYDSAVEILAKSNDPADMALAAKVGEFSRSLTDINTERVLMHQDVANSKDVHVVSDKSNLYVDKDEINQEKIRDMEGKKPDRER